MARTTPGRVLLPGRSPPALIGNVINNTGGSGVGAVGATISPATTPHQPQRLSLRWTSGISYNTDMWFDTYTGFHNIIANNIIVGEFDGSTNHTDGNGIILDLGGNSC